MHGRRKTYIQGMVRKTIQTRPRGKPEKTWDNVILDKLKKNEDFNEMTGRRWRETRKFGQQEMISHLSRLVVF